MFEAGTLAEASISCSIAVNSTSSLNLNEQFDAGCASAAWPGLASLDLTAVPFPKAAYQLSNSLVAVSSAFSSLGSRQKCLRTSHAHNAHLLFSWSLFTISPSKDRNPRWLASLCM